MQHCEFCQEFDPQSPDRFQSLYGELVPSRIVARTEHFVAVPTLGQLFTGSLLVLPIRHLETCACFPKDERSEMSAFADQMMERTSRFGHPIWFEHGATSASGAGCGIHHAHLHIVPLPWPTEPRSLFPEHTRSAANLREAWSALETVEQYLLIGDGKETLYLDIEAVDDRFPSQFFRRRLAEHFELAVPWDWRAYAHVESAVLETIKAGTCEHA